MTRDEVAKLSILAGFEHLDALLKLARPAVALEPRKRARGGVLTSRLGGLPAMPAGAAWPTRNGKSLPFVAQIALEEMPSAMQREGFPKSGILSFFYDAELGPWGFEPEDAGSSAVLYAPDPRAAVMPLEWPRDMPAACKYPVCRLVPEETITIPPWESVVIDEMKLSPAEVDRYVEIADKWTSIQAWANRSLLGGYPDQIQSDMMMQSELVSTGVTEDLRQDPRLPFFKRRAMRWRHLFQLQSYEPLGMNWGDAGCLYYWLRESDLVEQNFGAGWMILQCG